MREAHRRQREYYYAAVSVLVVKIVLLVFLCILLYVSLQLFPHRFENGPLFARYGVPILAACFILVLARFIYKNIKDLRESRPPRHR
jgi:amino acid permease